MLCINFDDSRYRELSERLLDICHPQAFIANGETCADGEKRLGGERRLDGEKSLDGERRLGSEPVTAKEDDVLYEPVETFYGDAETEFDATVAGVINGPKKDRMSRADRLEIIARLDKNGFFLIKGTIPLAAERLGCSPASVYRYLKEVGNRSRTQ